MACVDLQLENIDEVASVQDLVQSQEVASKVVSSVLATLKDFPKAKPKPQKSCAPHGLS